MPTKKLRTTTGTDLAFTYDGAEPGDGSPAGVVLALLIAQGESHRERCLACLNDASRALVPLDAAPPAPFFGDTTIHVTGTQVAGETATVDYTMQGEWSGGQPLPSSMVCQREAGQWRVDTMATMARMMSAMGDMMGAAQQGLGQLDTALTDLLANLKPPAPEERGGQP